jgi:hypothetical protein
MKETKTTKRGKSPGGVPIESSTPIGHEELEAGWVSEQRESDTPPEKLQPKRGTHEHKPLEPEQPLNPKRNLNSRKS